jgi:peptidyl-prolyl cis-trans isomerase D
VKVTAHHKAAVKPLAEVHDEIVELVRHERGVDGAKKAAEAAVAKLTSGEKIESLASGWSLTAEPAKFVSRGDPSIPAALRTAVFEAPRPTDKPVVKSANLDDGSSVVFIVSRTRVADTSKNPQLVQQENASLHPGGDGVLVIEVPVDIRRIGMVGDGVQRRATEDDGVFGLG